MIHIHCNLCGHGGEAIISINISSYFVNVHDLSTEAVYQFKGCYFHVNDSGGAQNDKKYWKLQTIFGNWRQKLKKKKKKKKNSISILIFW